MHKTGGGGGIILKNKVAHRFAGLTFRLADDCI